MDHVSDVVSDHRDRPFLPGPFGWGYVLAERNGTCARAFKSGDHRAASHAGGQYCENRIFCYEENIGFHIRATLAVDTLVSVVAFLIAGIHILSVENVGSAASFYYIMDFFCTACHGADPGLPALADPGGSDVDSGENFRTAEMR